MLQSAYMPLTTVYRIIKQGGWYKIVTMETIKRCLLICAGSLSLGLGVIGAFLPVLPTTPFLLLAAFCYVRSSKRLYHWLINHRVFGTYIYNYLTYRAITRSTRVVALIFLWGTLIISATVSENLHLRLFLLAVGIGVSIHLFVLKTMSGEDQSIINNASQKQNNERYCYDLSKD